MPRRAIFTQECPICGRPLEIRKVYQGKKVACPQCGGWFVAVDASRHALDIWNQNKSMINKADQLLEQCAVGSTTMN